MAEVYSRVRGEKTGRFIAGHVSGAIGREARLVLTKAEIALERVRANPGYTGDTNVWLYMEQGKSGDQKYDYYVVLDDPPDRSSPGAAWSIEYGHYAGPRDREHRTWIDGKWIIHDAAGIPRRAR